MVLEHFVYIYLIVTITAPICLITLTLFNECFQRKDWVLCYRNKKILMNSTDYQKVVDHFKTHVKRVFDKNEKRKLNFLKKYFSCNQNDKKTLKNLLYFFRMEIVEC